MNKYKVKRLPNNNWIGLFQTSINWKNVFILHWKFIDCAEFGFCILNFIIPVIDRSRSLFSINFYSWNEKPRYFVSIELLYLPSLDFRFGIRMGKPYFRNENIYGWVVRRRNKLSADEFFNVTK